MSFADEGFLATETSAMIERFRQDHAAWFELADRLNRMGMRLLTTARTHDAQQRLVRALFSRAVSNFQGAVLMAERGMTAEAGTLARACLETVFYQGAAAKDEGFIKELMADHAKHNERMVAWLQGLPAELQGLSADQLGQLEQSVSDYEGADWIRMWKTSEKAGLIDLYRSVYAHLSHTAAHPRAGALEQYADLDESGAMIGDRWGPHPEGIADSLDGACIAFLQAILIADETLNSSSMASEVQSCKERYDVLLGEAIAT
jgi:hypothetical protein